MGGGVKTYVAAVHGGEVGGWWVGGWGAAMGEGLRQLLVLPARVAS